MQNMSPVLVFTYKRLNILKKAITSLQNNPLSEYTELFIFSDGPKTSGDTGNVEAVRKYIKEIIGFRRISIHEAASNNGLANSIINGVSTVLENNPSVIVLEDDLIVSTNFLSYMNAALDFYKDNRSVFSISGYVYNFSKPAHYMYDSFLASRGCSWGWATWKDRWEKVDWNVSDYKSFKENKSSQKRFAYSGSDLNAMLFKQMNGLIDSWAIRWYYSQFKQGKLTVYPTVSKVSNKGFDEYATHTQGYNRYKTKLDDSGKTAFKFINSTSVDTGYQKKIQNKFSISQRIIFGRFFSSFIKLKNLLRKR